MRHDSSSIRRLPAGSEGREVGLAELLHLVAAGRAGGPGKVGAIGQREPRGSGPVPLAASRKARPQAFSLPSTVKRPVSLLTSSAWGWSYMPQFSQPQAMGEVTSSRWRHHWACCSSVAGLPRGSAARRTSQIRRSPGAGPVAHRGPSPPGPPGSWFPRRPRHSQGARRQGIEVQLHEVEMPGNDGWAEAGVLVDREPLRRDGPLQQAQVTKASGSAAWIASDCRATHFSAMLSRKRW